MSDVELTEADRAIVDALHAAIDGDFLVGAGMRTANSGDDVPLRDAAIKEVVWWAVRATAPILAARLSQEREQDRRSIRQLQGRLTEVAAVAEDRAETIQELKDAAEQVRAERDREWQRHLNALPDEMAEAWGGDAAWLTSGSKVATLVGDWLADLHHDLAPSQAAPALEVRPDAPSPRPTQEGER